MSAEASAPEFDLKHIATANRGWGLWRMMAGFRWLYFWATLSLGGIQAFVSYVTLMLWPIQDVARIYAKMQHAIASAKRVFCLVAAVPDVVSCGMFRSS